MARTKRFFVALSAGRPRGRSGQGGGRNTREWRFFEERANTDSQRWQGLSKRHSIGLGKGLLVTPPQLMQSCRSFMRGRIKDLKVAQERELALAAVQTLSNLVSPLATTEPRESQ